MCGLGAMSVLLLSACGQPAETVEAPEASSVTPTATPAPVPTTATDLEGACRDVVERMFGQTGEAVTFKAAGEGRAEVSWPAPVDGGVLSFECRADGDRVGLFREGRSMSVDVQMTAPAAKQEAR